MTRRKPKRLPPRLFIYGLDPEKWARKHCIEAFSHPCSECGRVLTTSIPFVQGQMRGLQAPPCECGNKQTPYGMVRDSKNGDLFSGDGLY
jgi:hypothetical protein